MFFSRGGLPAFLIQLKFLLEGNVLALILLVVPHSSVYAGKFVLFVKLVAGYREQLGFEENYFLDR